MKQRCSFSKCTPSVFRERCYIEGEKQTTPSPHKDSNLVWVHIWEEEVQGRRGVGRGGDRALSSGSCRFALLLTGRAPQRGCEVSGWIWGGEVAHGWGGVILAPWLPFADLGALAWGALWHVVQLSECRERMQQQSRLPLRRMKAQIFSCVIWKVASSIILWAHAGTDEEDEHYVFTTALNTAPPGVLFSFHHKPFLRCVQWAYGRGWIRGLTKMLHSSNVGNIYVLLQCLLGYNELSERRVVCTAVLLKHLPEQPRCSSRGNNRLSCFHSHSCAHVCICDSKRCAYHILTVH